jgi:hypothetical protein
MGGRAQREVTLLTHSIRNRQTVRQKAQINQGRLVTFSARNIRAQALAAQDGRGIGIMKSIPWPDFGKLCQYSTHGPETQICCRVLLVEGQHNRSWRWILESVNISRVCVR